MQTQVQFPLVAQSWNVRDRANNVVAECGRTNFTSKQDVEHAEFLANAGNVAQCYSGNPVPCLLRDCLATLSMLLHGAPPDQVLERAAAMLAAAYENIPLTQSMIAPGQCEALLQERLAHVEYVQGLLERDSRRQQIANKTIQRLRDFSKQLEDGEEIKVRVMTRAGQTRDVSWRKEGDSIVEYECARAEPAGHPEAPVVPD